MAEKKSFIIYYDSRAMIEELIKPNNNGIVSFERVGRLFMASLDYAQYGSTNVELDDATNVAFKSITAQITRDTKKYQSRCDKNRNNINKRWQNNTIEYDCIQTNTNYTDNDSHNDSHSDSHNDSDSHEATRVSRSFDVNDFFNSAVEKTLGGI